MMIRNKEIRHFAGVFLVLTVASAAAGLLLAGPVGGIWMMVLAACYGAAFFMFTKKRYERIADMSEQIDRVLHGQDQLFLSEEEEGELSILQSEIRKMTLRFREQNATLQKEKERLSDSLANIAHQIRTPLTSINLILSLLANNPKEAQRLALLREEEELLFRMESLITSLLKLSRIDAGIVVFQSVPVEVGELIYTSLRPFLISMDLHDIVIQTEIPKDVYIRGDLDWLSQAVQNILKNCMESIGDHGSVQIICEDTLLYTELRIHDSGPGFSKEDLFHLFDRFYRGKNDKTSGYGIGLALAKSVIIGQGGTITAGNHPDGMTVFSIRFPKNE